jgi:hypothetical protein
VTPVVLKVVAVVVAVILVGYLLFMRGGRRHQL